MAEPRSSQQRLEALSAAVPYHPASDGAAIRWPDHVLRYHGRRWPTPDPGHAIYAVRSPRSGVATGRDRAALALGPHLGRADSLIPVIEGVIDENPKAVDDFLNGKDTAIRFLVGQVMKATRGAADANAVMQLITEQLEMVRKA